MSDGQEIVFARSEVPVAFASASKSEQIAIIENGSISYFTAKAKLQSQMTNADQSQWINIGRENGLREKETELQPQLRELETLRQQYSNVTSVVESLRGQLYIRDNEEHANIKKIVSEKEKELEEEFAKQKSKLTDEYEQGLAKQKQIFAEDLEEQSKIKADQLSWEETKKAHDLETQNLRLQNELDNVKEKVQLTSIIVKQIEEKDAIIQDLQDTVKSLQEVKQTPNSQQLGTEGEENVQSILDEALSAFKKPIVKDVHKKNNEADFIVEVSNSKNQTINFKVDSKNSFKDRTRIHTSECDKMKNDVDGRVECCFGLFIALKGKIDGKINHLDIERSPKNKVIIYLCWLGMTREQKIESITDVVKVLIETVSLNEFNQEQQDKMENELKFLKKKYTRYIKDLENLAKQLKKSWDEATKLYNKMLKTSQSTEYIDSESESEEIPPAENPPPQRTRGKGKKQNKVEPKI